MVCSMKQIIIDSNTLILILVRGRKVFLSTNEICVGWRPKPKLSNGLKAWPKGYQ